MGWGKLGGIFSLKTIILACFLTPVSAPVVAPITPAYGQFQIIIPGFGYRRRGYRSRGYRGRSARRGGQQQQQQPTPSANSPGGAPVTSAKGYRSTSDK
jgi:hypothetical protein